MVIPLQQQQTQPQPQVSYKDASRNQQVSTDLIKYAITGMVT
jgi:hypothetical protein